MVNTLWRISSQKRFVVNTLWRISSQSVLWWIHSGAVELHLIFPPALCGEYTQALIELYSVVSSSPPQISTPPRSSYLPGCSSKVWPWIANWTYVQLAWRSLNLSRVMYPKLQRSSETTGIILDCRGHTTRWRCPTNNLELGTPEAVQALDSDLEMTFYQTVRKIIQMIFKI